MQHIVFFSGGVGSWGAAKRVAEKHGTDDLILLFTDTLMEDEDLYRFIDEAAANVGGELVTLADGRTPWQVFFDKRFLGNSRVDPCSRILKRELAREWIEKHYQPHECVLYLGIDWTEEHRLARSQKYWGDYQVEGPLCNSPYLEKSELLDQLRQEGIEPPRLYEMGFPHNNCGGFCIKAGKAHFRLLLEKLPDRYRQHEQMEEKLRAYLDKDVSILREQRNGVRRNITLRELRERIEQGEQVDAFDWGGCGCFSPEPERKD
jgi:3'-phosphoadenosine 5'-phosphosulfate sulfotransferase (PAPS reductase)/FAD synthetase